LNLNPVGANVKDRRWLDLVQAGLEKKCAEIISENPELKCEVVVGEYLVENDMENFTWKISRELTSVDGVGFLLHDSATLQLLNKQPVSDNLILDVPGAKRGDTLIAGIALVCPSCPIPVISRSEVLGSLHSRAN
jgi:hypothetical protein